MTIHNLIADIVAHIKIIIIQKKFYGWCRHSKNTEGVIKKLSEIGLVKQYSIIEFGKSQKRILYQFTGARFPILQNPRIVSLPKKRIYYNAADIKKIIRQNPFYIVSTNQGYFLNLECDKINIGGEVLFSFRA